MDHPKYLYYGKYCFRNLNTELRIEFLYTQAIYAQRTQKVDCHPHILAQYKNIIFVIPHPLRKILCRQNQPHSRSIHSDQHALIKQLVLSYASYLMRVFPGIDHLTSFHCVYNAYATFITAIKPYYWIFGFQNHN